MYYVTIFRQQISIACYVIECARRHAIKIRQIQGITNRCDTCLIRLIVFPRMEIYCTISKSDRSRMARVSPDS